jgi:hypothetical protein
VVGVGGWETVYFHLLICVELVHHLPEVFDEVGRARNAAALLVANEPTHSHILRSLTACKEHVERDTMLRPTMHWSCPR